MNVTGVHTIQDLGRFRIVSTRAGDSELQPDKLSCLALDDGGSVRLGARPDRENALASWRMTASD